MSWEMLGQKGTHADPNYIAGGIPALTPDDVRLALSWGRGQGRNGFGLSDRVFLFGMAAFLGHRGSLEQVETFLRHDLMSLATEEKWGSGKDRAGKPCGELTREDIYIIERMANLILFEVISAKSKHDTYAHEDALPTGSAAVQCPSCNGRGDDARRIAAIEREEIEDRARHRWLSFDHPRHTLGLCDLCEGRGRFLLTNQRRAQMCGVTLRTWERKWNSRHGEGMSIPQRWEAIAIGHVRKNLRADT